MTASILLVQLNVCILYFFLKNTSFHGFKGSDQNPPLSPQRHIRQIHLGFFSTPEPSVFSFISSGKSSNKQTNKKSRQRQTTVQRREWEFWNTQHYVCLSSDILHFILYHCFLPKMLWKLSVIRFKLVSNNAGWIKINCLFTGWMTV